MTKYVDPKTLNKDAMLGRAQSGTVWGAAPAMSAMPAASRKLRGIVKAAKGIKNPGISAAQALPAMPGVGFGGAKKKKRKKKNGPY